MAGDSHEVLGCRRGYSHGHHRRPHGRRGHGVLRGASDRTRFGRSRRVPPVFGGRRVVTAGVWRVPRYKRATFLKYMTLLKAVVYLKKVVRNPNPHLRRGEKARLAEENRHEGFRSHQVRECFYDTARTYFIKNS